MKVSTTFLKNNQNQKIEYQTLHDVQMNWNPKYKEKSLERSWRLRSAFKKPAEPLGQTPIIPCGTLSEFSIIYGADQRYHRQIFQSLWAITLLLNHVPEKISAWCRINLSNVSAQISAYNHLDERWVSKSCSTESKPWQISLASSILEF